MVYRQLIYNYPEQLFADAGVMAIEHADFEGVERLALVTGGEIISTFDEPEKVKLGHCDRIEEVSFICKCVRNNISFSVPIIFLKKYSFYSFFSGLLVFLLYM